MASKFFQRAEKTISFGDKALDELELLMNWYFDQGPYERTVQHDFDTGQTHLKYVAKIPPPEDEIERKVTEAVRSFKSALDQATLTAGKLVNPKIKDTDTLYFPWCDTFTGLKQRLRGKSCKIPPAVWKPIIRCKPYGTGKGVSFKKNTFRSLSKIANRNHSTGIIIACEIGSIKISGTITNPGGAVEVGGKRIWKPAKKEITI